MALLCPPEGALCASLRSACGQVPQYAHWAQEKTRAHPTKRSPAKNLLRGLRRFISPHTKHRITLTPSNRSPWFPLAPPRVAEGPRKTPEESTRRARHPRFCECTDGHPAKPA